MSEFNEVDNIIEETPVLHLELEDELTRLCRDRFILCRRIR